MDNDQDHADLSALVKAAATRYEAPPDLRLSIGAALARADPSPRSQDRWQGWGWLKLGAAFACGVAAALLSLQLHLLPVGRESLAGEVVAAHVRSLMVAHLEDVPSTDRHTVKPWFAGKLDYSPPVADFADRGFPLAGGRLDYIGQRPVGALVYRHHGHAINVFIWPLRDGARPEATATRLQGFNLAAWGAAGMQYWVVSDLNDEELQQFTRLLRGEGG